jgi:hypothetical protein
MHWRSSSSVSLVAIPVRFVFLLASISTFAVAIWLLFVTTFVLPGRDPAHVPMWRMIGFCGLAFSALSWACLAPRIGTRTLHWALAGASSAAIAFAARAIYSMINLPPGGHFEGYLVILGLLLGGHGAAGLVYCVLSMWARPALG